VCPNLSDVGLIDVHSHVVPKRFPDNPVAGAEPRWPCMRLNNATQATVMIDGRPYRELDDRSWSVARRMEDMDRTGVSRQVLSPMPELLSYWFKPTVGLEICRWMNHMIGDMVASAPSRFSGLGIVPLQDPVLAAKELVALKSDGFRGVEVGSNVNGVFLGDARFEEFLAAAAELDLAIFVHALHPIGAERLQTSPDLIPLGAFPLDTALSALSLIRAGVPERFPQLRFGFSHGGGAIVPLTHRLAQGWRVTEGFRGSLPKVPEAYASAFFYDSLVYHPGYLAHLANEFAPNQVFCGTDYPYSIMETDPAGFIGTAAVNDDRALRHGAAQRFLGLWPKRAD